MAGLTLNQMYKQSGIANQGVSYKDWIASEENLYNAKIESGKIQGQMPFPYWMENRWKGKLNFNASGADGKFAGILTGLKEVGKDVLAKTILNKPAGTSAVNDTGTYAPEYPEPPKRILGMKPVVFWTVTAVTTIAAIYVTVKVVKKIRKS